MAFELPNIDWSPAAWRDLDQTLEYLEDTSPAAAGRLAGLVLEALQMLSDHPESGPVFREHNGRREFRRLLIGRYLLFYTLRNQRVLLVRFWDARRSPNELALE
jgi:plasmid stabilization system protein ParE